MNENPEETLFSKHKKELKDLNGWLVFKVNYLELNKALNTFMPFVFRFPAKGGVGFFFLEHILQHAQSRQLEILGLF